MAIAKRGPGRPRIFIDSFTVQVVVPRQLVQQIDLFASTKKISRSSAAYQLLVYAINNITSPTEDYTSRVDAIEEQLAVAKKHRKKTG